MEIVYRKLSDMKKLEGNPRKITQEQLETLKQSIERNKDYFEARPLILSDRTGELVVIAGNQRYEACRQLGIEQCPTVLLEGLTEEREKEIIIRDNVNNGEWDEELLLLGWNAEDLDSWGVLISDIDDNDSVKTDSETSRLSSLEYKGIYYEPKNIPELELEDCLNLEKYNKKVEAIELLPLSDEQKDILKMFAYRFIKIDFEGVANYYAYNATEEEKRAIERLRLVLVDNGVDGFIGDDLIRVLKNDKSEVADD